MYDVYDVVVIGCGPAGMMAAIKAGERGLKTIVLEKKSRPAIKLSITGKGRCNLTNSASIKEFTDCFHNGKFLYNSFNVFSNLDTISFFENVGVSCKLERGGRYFPTSGKSQDIVDVLVKNVKKFSKIMTSCSVKSIKKNENETFNIYADGLIVAKNIIIACGGASYPSTGAEGDGYKIAKAFGHTVKEPLPSLVPVVLESEYLKELQGLKLKNIEVSLIASDKIIAKEFGEMKFTNFGATGPVILTISRLVSERIHNENMFLSLNLKPALSLEQLNQRLLREINNFAQYQIKDFLQDMLPIQMVKPFINYCGLNITKKCSQISKSEREKMLSAFSDSKFKIVKTRDFKEAIITRGGIATDEINQKTMESKLIEGLYFCGEIIDIDAPTGGFNLQAAFSTGYLAGGSIKTE
ncbi:MAG: NAD(P)/FAD-dependent oxidoreductase [Endomicrobium sp.]|uniref:NAD(P)/FAD-dependent oxidoreductase n=1 Tax=Candidatus Endomicrobiellum pyrsonymphae TaxID=1408203 RepID=UPI00357E7257|nr:NAD(P)/FAD-dependent oxidoreductase [Endomicrobium sp.]